MPTGVEVTGLKATQDNFEKLDRIAQREIGREALKALGWALAKPMKAATYTTFQRRTGAIKQLLGVHVRREPESGRLTGYVEEFAGKITGAETPFKALIRKRRGAESGRRSVSVTASTAYWWRFLEFGTGPRHQQRTPDFLRTGKIARTDKGRARQLARAQRWQASPTRGGIKTRKWLRPLFGGDAPDAIRSFRDTFMKLVDAATSAMPKK
jgi:HK97 gp10 family phage protein